MVDCIGMGEDPNNELHYLHFDTKNRITEKERMREANELTNFTWVKADNEKISSMLLELEQRYNGDNFLLDKGTVKSLKKKMKSVEKELKDNANDENHYLKVSNDTNKHKLIRKFKDEQDNSYYCYIGKEEKKKYIRVMILFYIRKIIVKQILYILKK